MAKIMQREVRLRHMRPRLWGLLGAIFEVGFKEGPFSSGLEIVRVRRADYDKLKVGVKACFRQATGSFKWRFYTLDVGDLQ